MRAEVSLKYRRGGVDPGSGLRNAFGRPSIIVCNEQPRSAAPPIRAAARNLRLGGVHSIPLRGPMCALGQVRLSPTTLSRSALRLEADLTRFRGLVRLGPGADLETRRRRSAALENEGFRRQFLRCQ